LTNSFLCKFIARRGHAIQRLVLEKGRLMKDVGWFRRRARELYQDSGEIEVDDGAPVSIGEGAGAYVQAWVWVDSEETPAQPITA